MKHTIPMPGNSKEILENDVLIPEKREAALACIHAYLDGKDTGEIKTVVPEEDIISVEAEHLFNAKVKQPGFSLIQGGYFDGENFYEGFVQWKNGGECAVIGVFAKDGTYVRESEELDICHCNTITPIGGGKLLIALCDSRAQFQSYKILDKTTLKILDEGTLPFQFMSADYCAETGLYACTGIGYGNECWILDENMNVILDRQIVFQSGSAPQNFYPTEDRIYSPRYIYDEATGEFSNYIHVYSWDLRLKCIYSFGTEGSKQELESISVIDGTAYLICGNHNTQQLVVYKCTLPEN